MKPKHPVELVSRCRILENRCAEYVRELERANRRLEEEVAGHRNARRKLSESDACFRTLFRNTPFGAVIVDLSGKILSANDAVCRLLGYSERELTDKTLADLAPRQDGEPMENLLEGISHGTDAGRIQETRFLKKSGEFVWGSQALSPVVDDRGHPVLVIGMIEDISERKNREEIAVEQKKRLERMVEERTAEIRTLQDRLRAENIFLRQELSDHQPYGELVGDSPAIQSIVSQVELVAPTDASVLIQGESGTGKELVAREIHKRSRRSDRPMIKVNCATIPKDLYESEFFGHIKGAFTGAIQNRIGRFEAADGGTIFLDEVGEIPIDLQSKLLRVLQDGEFERVGEGKTRKVDVRVVAATNKNIQQEVEEKRFRDDLYYRLNVFPIHVAPLRERIDDLPALAAHFAEKLSGKLNLPVPEVSEADIEGLGGYHWPGNVRELENTMERAMILCRSGKLRIRPILEMDPASTEAERTPRVGEHLPGGGAVLREEEVKALERSNTINALVRSHGKIYGKDGAAASLGIKPTTLIERMKRMKIRKPEGK